MSFYKGGKMKFFTPLRYPGGKAKLAKFIKIVFEKNNLLDGHYVEPYAGGAGIALSLLYHEYVKTIHINDLNKSVYSFWFSALNHTDELCRLINDTDVTIEEWHRQKAVQASPEACSILDLGFSTFFLNRTNRSGIISGGVIGGYDQTGKWKIDARYNKQELVKRLEKIGGYKSRINLTNMDAAEFILNRLPEIPLKSLIYLDPPYYAQGGRLYDNHYRHNDHEHVSKLVSQMDHNWIVSYDAAQEVCKLYHDFRMIIYGLSYSAAKRYEGSEVMIFCEKLDIPSVKNPAKLDAA
jgi:DNA adenine methylase